MSVIQFIQEALECSVYLSPRDIGLTQDELQEAAAQANYRPGETRDAIAAQGLRGQGLKYMPPLVGLERGLSSDFFAELEPDYRDPKAFEFVRSELAELAREVGVGEAVLARDVLVERGIAKGLDRSTIEIAIAIDVLNGFLDENERGVRRSNDTLAVHLAVQQIHNRRGRRTVTRPTIAKIYGIVKDIVSRRGDGRPAASNPLDAFLACLDVLGQDRFRAWWVQKQQELRLADTSQQATMALVVAASLAEAALTFVVPRAVKYGLMSKLDASRPRTWRFEDLIKGARSADPNKAAILDDRTAQRALDLNANRQRIHAGYLIEIVPSGPIPDLKPEEARDGIQTADLVVRRVVDWLIAHPQGPGGSG